MITGRLTPTAVRGAAPLLPFAAFLATFLALGLLVSPVATVPRGVLLVSVALAATLASLSAIDLHSGRLPDALTLPLTLSGLGFVAVSHWTELGAHIAAVGAGFAAIWLVDGAYRAWRGRRGIGLGDAKLFAAAGAWVGPEGLASVLVVASLGALACVGLAAAMHGQAVGAQQRLAFGPFLCLGFWVVWVAGPLSLGAAG
jgi:leader peptidase (prepilin peptidase)/N-methyltransferase